MRKRKTVPWSCAVLVCWPLVGFLLATTPTVEAAYCRVSSSRPARTFYRGEQVRFTLQAPGPLTQGTLVIRDYYGADLRAVPVVAGQDVPRMVRLPGVWPWGIYYLRFTFANGQSHDDAFCVIPRPDEQPGAYGPFSWRLGSDAGDEWGALSQAGCRLIRRDLDWPSTMPTADRVDLGKAQRLASLAEQYGMQLIPILGYSPRWAGLEPANATGRAAGATHTWAPESTAPWRQYVSTVAAYLNTRQVSWPASAAIRPQALGPTASLPLVHSWEIWNEADQNFYYGYWGRYVDLLRVASGEIKRQDPGATVLYGGSCGHWTELGQTYRMLGQFFFDRLAFHPGGENLDQAFETYFCGAPQIGNGYGLYRPATMTEAYPYCPSGITESQYLLRLYGTLSKWRLDTFCTFDGGRVTGGPDPDSPALLWRQGVDLVPNAKYVALAVARCVLSDCVYVGPLDWGEGTHVHLFLRRGWPLVIAWADSERSVTIAARTPATTGDEMGRQTPLPVNSNQAQVTLRPAPQVLRGLAPAYVAEAVANQADLFLRTPQGFRTDRAFGYIADLEYDAKWAWSAWPATFRAALRQATTAMERQPARGGPLLGVVQAEVNAQVVRVLRKAQEAGSVSGRAQATVWRLQTLSEWLGAVIDSYEERWGTSPAPAAEKRDLLAEQIEALSGKVDDREQGLSCPLGVQSLQRARESLRRAQATGGLGARRAARVEYASAQLYQQLVPPRLTGVVAAPDFLTGTQLVKAVALRPGQQHEVRCYVHNFTPGEVSGVLTLQAPPGWQVSPREARFTAPAAGISPPIMLRVTIPGPSPWVTKPAWTAAGTVNLQVPESLDPAADLILGGRLADGRELLSTPYPVLVGEL